MSLDTLMALCLFALVSSITPGPNNMMLLTSGANFGFTRTFPHMLGIGFGMALMLVLVGLGIIQLFDAFPATYTLLKVLSVTYMLYLAFRIATSVAPTVTSAEAGKGDAKPMSMLAAMAFQWVNPKAWAMALTAISVYAPEQSLNAVLWIALAFCIVNFPSISLWALLGTQLQRVLTNAKRLQIFNWSMATMLVASLYPMLT